MSNISSPGSGYLNFESRLDEMSNYSYEERCIGTWIDGKPLYRKMINFGALPNNEIKTFSIGVENIRHIHINIGESIWTSSSSSFASGKLAYTLTHPNIYSVLTNGSGEIMIQTNADLSSYKVLVCIEYTKTSD